MFKKFKERKEVAEKRLRDIELEIGLRDEPENKVGGLLHAFIFYSGQGLLHKQVTRQSKQIGKLETQLRELRNYLELDYTDTPMHLDKKPKEKQKSKTWKDQITDAIESAIDERGEY